MVVVRNKAKIILFAKQETNWKGTYVVERHFITCAFLLLHASSVLAHPRHTDPILAELNDYLLTLQVLRHDNSKADKLFQLWQHVSEESWKIRMCSTRQRT